MKQIHLNKYYKKIFKVILIALLIFLLLSFISFVKLGVINPFSSTIGLIRIHLTNTEFVEINKLPRVVIAKPNNKSLKFFLKTLEEEGYINLEDEQMASRYVFDYKGDKIYVFFTVHALYVKWTWYN